MAEMKPLVSIVVLFYNIEGCVRYCMESLMNQTFRNYEIICIDDGSTDGTDRLLDEYNDEVNIHVHHKENGGPSESRNYGVSVANGELITFVDGDDIVSPQYLEHMVEALKRVPGALIVGSFKNCSEVDARNGRVEWANKPVDSKVLTRAQAIDEFLHNDITESAWACLAPKSAYRGDALFPVGKVYEDLAAFPGLLMQFEQVVKLSNEDYGYVVRDGTISRARKVSIKQALDYLDALEALHVLPVHDSKLAYRQTLAIMRMRPILKEVADEPEAARAMEELGLRALRRNLGICVCDSKVSLANKARVCSFAISPALHDVFLSIYTRRWAGAYERQNEINKLRQLCSDEESKSVAAGNILLPAEIKASELALLVEFDSFCKKEALRYSLSGGTLLGAVRHGGFIPWDDDIDVNMPRPDFDKLTELLNKGTEQRFIHEYVGNETKRPIFTKIADPAIWVKEKYSEDPRHLWLDVFPMDGLPNNVYRAKAQYAKAERWRKLFMLSLADARQGKTSLKRHIKGVIVPIVKASHIGTLASRKLVEVCKEVPYGTTDYIGGLAWGIYGIGERVSASAFDECGVMKFEGHEFPVMSCWDDYLRGLYGDYMTPPPVEKRVNHELLAWREESTEK